MFGISDALVEFRMRSRALVVRFYLISQDGST
jgi:hypothetical protein